MSTSKPTETDQMIDAGMATLNALKDKVLSEEGFAEIKTVVEDMANDAAEVVRKYPGRSMAGAFVAGILLGAWLNRK